MTSDPNDQNSRPARKRRSLFDLLIGPARDLRDPRVYRTVSLIAFLAWVGMGSDGISSSCYGPAEMFLVLGEHRYLAVFLAVMTAITVLVISASYSQIIDLFPTGGGGYLVATRLLGPYPGLVAGSALVVDYVLTISISIASGADAIFSFLPIEWLPYKFWTAVIVVALMILMNLRGVKESVMTLMPIFLSFIVMHAWLVLYAVLSHAPEISSVVQEATTEARNTASAVGWFGLVAIFFRAYSLGGGTFTGIEAVSNGLPILREPKQVTGKRTMTYMAISLSFIASGLLLGYLLMDVDEHPGRTLNAVFFERVTEDWTVAGIPLSATIVLIALLSEGALLFVAAQTGFIGGPQVLANMAMDRWTPRRFASLSTRLVSQDGVIAMGLAALIILFATGARVQLLVVLYAINVFVTFTLSQLGMSVHWWRARHAEPRWIRKIFINGTGCSFTALIVTMMLIFKFNEGGWATIFITGGLIFACYMVRRHYDHVRLVVEQLEADILPKLYSATREAPPSRNPDAPTAVLLVNGFNGLGLATLLSLRQLFGEEFRNVIFVAVGEVDAALLKGHDEVKGLEKSIADDLSEYCQFASDLGYYPELRAGLGADVVEELRKMCVEIAGEFRHVVFFAGQLVFADEVEGFLGRFLHNHTAFELQSWLQLYGLSLVILPVRVTRGQVAGVAMLPPETEQPKRAAT